MKDIIVVRTINEYQTEVVVNGRRILLTDMEKVNAAKAKRRAAKAKRRKVGDAIINAILVIVFIAFMFWGIWLFFTYDEGYYEADYINDEGQLIDIDGDGDYYHWVDTSN